MLCLSVLSPAGLVFVGTRLVGASAGADISEGSTGPVRTSLPPYPPNGLRWTMHATAKSTVQRGCGQLRGVVVVQCDWHRLPINHPAAVDHPDHGQVRGAVCTF